MTRRRALTGKTLSLVLLFITTACGSAAPPPPPAGGGKTVDAATTGMLSGRALFTGVPPAPETLKMATDKVCVAGAGPNPQSDRVLLGADGGLENVFVHVKQGLDPANTFETPAAPAVLDQQGCRYTPRVVGVRTGQAST